MTRQEISDSLTGYPMLDAAIKTIQGLDEQIKIVKVSKLQGDGQLHTADSKRKKIDELTTLKNELAYNVLNDIQTMKDPTFLMSNFGTKLYKEYSKKNIKTRAFQKIFAELQTKIFD